jgi:hypothetical protein
MTKIRLHRLIPIGALGVLLTLVSAAGCFAQTAQTTATDPNITASGSDATIASTSNTIAAASDDNTSGSVNNSSGSTSGAKTSSTGSRASRFCGVIKANILETFQLDPRLKKDLTEGNPALRPIKFMQDDFVIGYTPAITWSRTGSLSTGSGGQWLTSYDKRGLNLYLAGPLTKHLSGWFQMLPVETNHGFFQYWELFQGLANYGGEKTFVQVKGGQCFNWQNAGWGGADRTVTLTSPGVYTAFNGFDPTSVSKTISVSATGLNWTTGKIFGYWQPQAGTTVDPNISPHRGYGMGLSLEKLIGKTGISGVQSNLTIGNTPVYNNNVSAESLAQQNLVGQAAFLNALANGASTDDASAAASAASSAIVGNPAGTQSSPFVWWTSWINKSFQDKKGFVRANPSFGMTVFRVKRQLDDPSLPEARATGYGYTFDLVTIPVRSYWTTVLRYDNFRINDLTHKNTTYTFTVGNAFDFHTGNKGRIRITFDYQYTGQKGVAPSHALILGFWPIW